MMKFFQAAVKLFGSRKSKRKALAERAQAIKSESSRRLNHVD